MELQFKQSQASFSKAPEMCQACKVIFNSSLSKNREEYMPKNFLYEENLCLYEKYVNKTGFEILLPLFGCENILGPLRNGPEVCMVWYISL